MDTGDRLVQEMYKRMFGNGDKGNYIPRTFRKTVGGLGGPKRKKRRAKKT